MAQSAPDSIRRALGASCLAALPPALQDEVLVGALPIELPRGSTIYRNDDAPRCVLVVSGLIRVFLSAPDGQTITVRYARTGELLGIPTLILGPVPVSVQMVTDVTALALNGPALVALGQRDAQVGWLLAREVTHRLSDTLDAVAQRAFGSLHQRVARHLLDLAVPGVGSDLLVPVTQQEVAEAVGSARPAVARIIADFRHAGLVATAAGGLALLDPDGLAQETWSSER